MNLRHANLAHSPRGMRYTDTNTIEQLKFLRDLFGLAYPENLKIEKPNPNTFFLFFGAFQAKSRENTNIHFRLKAKKNTNILLSAVMADPENRKNLKTRSFFFVSGKKQRLLTYYSTRRWCSQ